MKISLTAWQKVLIALTCFAIAVIGFMVKLPSSFRHFDKELHAAFYFLAAALLNVLFAGTKLIRHVVIFGLLYLFGMAIEYGQAYSNKFYRTPIHGRFDPEDVQWNLKGLLAFSLLWILFAIGSLIFKNATQQDSKYKSESSKRVID